MTGSAPLAEGTVGRFASNDFAAPPCVCPPSPAVAAATFSTAASRASSWFEGQAESLHRRWHGLFEAHIGFVGLGQVLCAPSGQQGDSGQNGDHRSVASRVVQNAALPGYAHGGER